MAAERALRLLDLTSLDDGDTPASTLGLCARALTLAGPVAAVCVHRRFVPTAKRALTGTGIRVATVANFPTGDGSVAGVAEEVRNAAEHGADEVDVVLPYRALLAGEVQYVADVLAIARERSAGLTLKVIVESGALTEDACRQACALAIAHGADFLKTSTGKNARGATPEAAAILLGACAAAGRPVGFKASGGVRTLEDANAYLELSDRICGTTWASPTTFRFGASALLDVLLAVLSIEATKPPKGTY